MSHLQIRLFRQLTVHANGGNHLDMGSPTARSLFAYLVLNQGQVIDRRRLAFQFWPHTSEQAARRNLRQYLHRLRRSLETIDPNGRILYAEGNDVSFIPPPQFSLDVAEFETAVTPASENLPHAIELYSGDLLEDIYDDWVIEERERLARLYREALLRLIDQQEKAGQFANAIRYAEKYVAAEPYLESAHTRLMHLHYLAGDRGRVKQQYEQLCRLLEEELGAEPLPETVRQYDAMLAGAYTLPALPTPVLTAVTPAIIPTPITRPEPLPTASITPPHFVGRVEESKWLREHIEYAATSQGGFCFIQGESGVGKSRLVDEVLDQLETAVYLFRGRGHEFESMIPYSLLSQALHEAAPTLPWQRFVPPPAWLAALLPLLPDLPTHFPGYNLEDQPTAVAHHIIEGLGNLLLTLTRNRPVILYLDNLHWADMPTWNFLGYLAQRAVQTRLLIIGVVRAEDTPHERMRLVRKLQRQKLLTSLTLNRLSQPETYELVRHLMKDEQLDPIFLRRIYEETEGNPFFIIETTRAVQEAGGDWTRSVPTDQTGQRPFFAIPLQVQAVIESRLDKLGEESRAALGVAAAIGREFSFELLHEVSQFDTQTLLDALDEWLVRGLVREQRDGYDFTHDKIGQVAYQQLSRARRQWIHFQVAEWLAQNQPEADSAQLAHHYYQSSDPAKALPYLAQAGQRALSVRSYAEAREFGLQAIGLLGRFPKLSQTDQTERVDLNLQLAQAYAFTNAHAKALQILQETERTAEAIGDMRRLTQIFHRSAQIFWLQGQPATADTYARRTLRHAEELDDAELRFAALRMLGRCGIALSQFDDAISYLLRHIDLAERGWTPVDLPAVYGYLGVAYARVGSWQRALDAAQTGLDRANAEIPGAMHLVARMQLAFVYGELYEWQQALKVAAPLNGIWEEEGMTPHLFMLRAVIGRCLVHQGEAGAGLAQIQAALQWAEDVEYRVLTHVVHGYLAQAQYFAGEYETALGTAVTATKLAHDAGNRWAKAVALRTQAESEMRLKKPDWQRIEDNLIQSMHILRDIRARPDLARTYLALRRLYDRAGLSAWAVDCHFRATSIFEELGMSDELRGAQGQASNERQGAVVIHGLDLRGPNSER